MDPDRIDRLFAVPLEDFVEERKRVARELRAAGDRDAAAEVAKLPKPTPPAWALNWLAREDPDAVGAWLAAADALRDASARPGAGLREAMAAHRDATRVLLGTVRDRARPAGRALSEPMLERVRALLQAATVDEEQAEALRAGRMVEGDEPFTLFGGPAEPGEAAEERPRPRRAEAAEQREAERAAREREAERKERERAERIAQLERHVAEAEEKLARLQGEAEERDAAAEAADARLEEARRTLNRTESEAEAAHGAADDAHIAVAAAERELRQLTRQLRNVSG